MTVPITWSLTTLPDTQPVPVSDPPPIAESEVSVEPGRGILRPFRRDAKNDWANGSSVALIRSNVGQILGTRAQSDFTQGELPWRPEFGSWLYLLRQRLNSDVLVEQARRFVVRAIERWESRVRVTGTEITREKSEGGNLDVLRIRVLYAIVDDTGRVIVSNLDATVTLPVA